MMNERSTLIVRRALPTDLSALLQVFAAARRYMVETGNPHQWKSDYPSETLLLSQIHAGYCRVVVSEDAGVVGTFCLIPGEDPTYAHIEGKWLNSFPYATIHRLASNGMVSGVADACLNYCALLYPNLRIDTHADNHVMQKWLARTGFIYCGVIHVADGSPRRAYQRYIEK